MPSRQIEQALDRLSALRTQGSPQEREAELRRGLQDKVNVVIARAAKLTAEWKLRALIQELSETFRRLLQNPVKSDPGCRGKEAIAKALADLEHTESDIFRLGVRHVQFEPVWGGEEDTAAGLRGVCGLALLQCTDLTRNDKLWETMRLLTEKSPSLRKDAIAALRNLEGHEAAFLLRLKLQMGDSDTTVIGEAFEALLRVEGDSAIGFVAEFLKSPQSEVREEATLALGNSRLESAITVLQAVYSNKPRLIGSEVILRALGLSRQPAAMDTLLSVLKTGRVDEAVDALAALALWPRIVEVRAAITQAVSARSENEIARQFQSLFAEGTEQD